MKQYNKLLSKRKGSHLIAINKNSTFEEKKAEFLSDASDIYSAEKLLKEIIKGLDSDLTKEEKNKKTMEALIGFELDTHFALTETTSARYRALVVKLCKQIIQEYDCKTPSEKALAEIIAGAFVRQLRCASRLEDGLGSDNLNSYTASIMSVIGKELDRAHRQYLSAIQTLRIIKQPPLNVSIKTNTAIVGQNQLIQENQNVNPK